MFLAVVALCCGVAHAQTPAGTTGETLFDFVAARTLESGRLQYAEVEALLLRFPHPTASAVSRCDPNRGGTPAASRMGGRLLPTVTSATGAFTRVGARQTAYLIDYCETNVGQPSLRRLLVLEGNSSVFDTSLSDADRLVFSRDIDGDGRDELLLALRTWVANRVGVEAQLVTVQARGLHVRGRWHALDECELRFAHRTGVRLVLVRNARGVTVRALPVREPCEYPPSPAPNAD